MAEGKKLFSVFLLIRVNYFNKISKKAMAEGEKLFLVFLLICVKYLKKCQKKFPTPSPAYLMFSHLSIPLRS